MPIDYKMLAATIRRFRLERGFTQEDLAEYTGLSSRYIGNIEQGSRRPSADSILLLCQALGVTPNDLLQDSISSEMLAGLCVPVQDDPHALRDSMLRLRCLFEDELYDEDDKGATLFGIPIQEIPSVPERERFISISEYFPPD